jgi:acyl carrier protein
MPETIPSSVAWQSQPPSVQAIHARLAQVMPLIVTPLRPDAPFTAGGGDSIDFVELLCTIDANYGVRLTVDELAPLQTVGELLILVDRRATKRPAAPAP